MPVIGLMWCANFLKVCSGETLRCPPSLVNDFFRLFSEIAADCLTSPPTPPLVGEGRNCELLTSPPTPPLPGAESSSPPSLVEKRAGGLGSFKSLRFPQHGHWGRRTRTWLLFSRERAFRVTILPSRLSF